tara:strand:+ start:5683 stop:7032 length:1350 start_codon:yes stop_codon:yes gene_type:complete
MTKTTNKPTTVTENVAWDNDSQPVTLHPKSDAPEELNLQPIDLAVMTGLTIPDFDRVKKSSARVKLFKDGADYKPAKNVPQVLNAYLRSIGANPSHYDLQGAISQVTLPAPEIAAKKEAAPKITDWNDAPESVELAAALTSANNAATAFVSNETGARKNLKALGAIIASVDGAFENKAVKASWLASAGADLNSLGAKNGLGELAFLGRLPDAFVDGLEDRAASAKTIQMHFNGVKNAMAGVIAGRVWKGAKAGKMPTVAAMQKVVLAELESYTLATGPDQAVAIEFYGALTGDIATEDGGSFNFIAMVDGLPVAASDPDGVYSARTVFGTGKRPNELLLAILKEVIATTPLTAEEADEKEEADEQEAAAKTAAPRTFEKLSITQAAIHLARILSAHGDDLDVLALVQSYADSAEKNTWSQVLGDAQAELTAQEQAEADANAEQAGDDAA